MPTRLRPAPLSLHPKNRHYFLFRGKPAILVGSGVYGAVVHRDFDYVVYLDELRRLGLNQTRLFTGSYVARSSSGGEQYADSLVPRGRLLAPWARSDTPGYALGGNKFDVERWDPEYFTRLRHFVAEAGKRGDRRRGRVLLGELRRLELDRQPAAGGQQRQRRRPGGGERGLPGRR